MSHILRIHEQGQHAAAEEQEPWPRGLEGEGQEPFPSSSEVLPREKGSKVMTPVLGKEQRDCGQRGMTVTRGVANADGGCAPLCPFQQAEFYVQKERKAWVDQRW